MRKITSEINCTYSISQLIIDAFCLGLTEFSVIELFENIGTTIGQSYQVRCVQPNENLFYLKHTIFFIVGLLTCCLPNENLFYL